MKKHIIAVFTIIVSLSQLDAQISEGGIPPSFSLKILKSSNSADLTLPKIKNIEDLLEEDKANPIPFRYSIIEDVHVNIKDKGYYFEDESGNKIWQYSIVSQEAFSLGLIFEKYKLPSGAKLFVYTPDRDNIIGAFTEANNKGTGMLQLQELPGKQAIIEYFEPKNADFEGELVLGRVGQAYKNLFEDLPDDSFIGINCPIGDDWQLEKHAVVKYTSTQGSSGISCTGVLVNNTAKDGTPYMLTANHCISTQSHTNTLVAYFNYEKADCQSSVQVVPATISGATLISTKKDYDFSLARLSVQPPSSYQPYYAGWSIEGKESPNGTSIHHPSGKEKSISIDYDTIKNNEYQLYTSDNNGNVNILPPNSTWEAYFDRGLSTHGSSGSPLFDNKKRVIGSLSAGPEEDLREAYFVRFDKAWNPNGSDSTAELKHWLDPKNSSPTTLDGYIPYPNTTPPDANFTAEFRGICLGSEIRLTDKTTFGANLWQWEFSPNSITYIEGDNSSQNPVVKFNETTEYTVTLTAQNNTGTSTRTRNAYVSTENLNVKTRRITNYSSCISTFQGLQILATGAETYHWFVNPPTSDFLELQNTENDTLIVELKSDINPAIPTDNFPDSLFNFKIYVEGIIDSCSVISEYDLSLSYHNNDNIANAFPLLIDSLQGPFDNSCATVEEKEPIPQIDDCTTQGEWCGCELGNEYRFILGNSTWFTFLAPESGIVGIETFGYDNQIAIYEAESAEDILSGDKSKYKIIGANDDYSENDFSAKIPSLAVTPGKKYWIQADGSACNTTGQFTIKISPEALVDIEPNFSISNNIANIFPNPAKDFVTIVKKSNSSSLDITLFDFNGKLVYKNKIASNSITLDTKKFARGFYIVQILDNNEIQTNKLIIE